MKLHWFVKVPERSYLTGDHVDDLQVLDELYAVFAPCVRHFPRLILGITVLGKDVRFFRLQASEVSGNVGSDEKSIGPHTIRPQRKVALFLCQMTQCSQRTPKVRGGIVSCSPIKVLLVRYRNRFKSKDTTVFDNNDPRSDGFDGLPYPVVVSVNVNREESNVTAKSGLFQK